jgi:calcineurin-like phosphoesterase family protein
MSAFFISDTHFGHSNILKFQDADGKPVRTFSSVEEMDETMVERWNKTVCAKDTVYHLGDVAIRRQSLGIMERLNGRKVLLKGNHDIYKLKDYALHFDDIRAYKVYPDEGIICSHIPLHLTQVTRFGLNVHGHMHTNTIANECYLNVCVEQTDYRPVSLDEILVHARVIS